MVEFPRTRAVSHPVGLSDTRELVLVLPRWRAATAPVPTVVVDWPKIRPKNAGCVAEMVTCTMPGCPEKSPAEAFGGKFTCMTVPFGSSALLHAALDGLKKPLARA